MVLKSIYAISLIIVYIILVKLLILLLLSFSIKLLVYFSILLVYSCLYGGIMKTIETVLVSILIIGFLLLTINTLEVLSTTKSSVYAILTK